MLIEFQDLKNFCNKNLDKKIYALFGYKLLHSLSYHLHNYIIKKELGFNKNIIYILVNIKKNDFEKAVIVAKKYLFGFNITMPYKQTIIKFLDIYSKKLININTVNIKKNKLLGYNTDIYGFIYIINKIKISINKKTILIFGYGSLAKTIINYLLKNFYKINILVCTRNTKNLYNKKNILFFDFNNIPKKYDIIINCTPIGMFPNIEETFPIKKLYYKTKAVIDTIYNPLQTSLIKLCIKHNIKNYSNGLNMLIVQAIYSNNIWHQKNSDLLNNISKCNLFLKICLIKIKINQIYYKQNIILCGFTTSGKTTFGFILSKLLKMNFLDTDLIIKNSLNMNIKKIFEYFGESFFRKIENQIINYIIPKCNNNIISLGGGTMTIKNFSLFENHGLILFFYSKFNDIILNILKYKPNSPLLKQNLELIFYQRLNIYIQNSNIIIYINFKETMYNNINTILDSI